MTAALVDTSQALQGSSWERGTVCGQASDEWDLDIGEEAPDVVMGEEAGLSCHHAARKDCFVAFAVEVVAECRRYPSSSH